MSVCKSDITAHCPNLEFTGEVIVCLLNWTSPSKLSSSCLSSLTPYKESEPEVERSEEDERRANARRRRRNKAAGMAREQKNREKNKEEKKDRKRKRRGIKVEKEL